MGIDILDLHSLILIVKLLRSIANKLETHLHFYHCRYARIVAI